MGVIIYNDGNAPLRIKFGTTASATDFTQLIPKNSSYEAWTPTYTGRIDGIWDTATGQTVSGPFEGHTSIVTSIAFSYDGKRVISGSDDKTVRIWDAEIGQTVSGSFEGTVRVLSVAFSHDGKRVVSGSTDSTVHIWGAETGQTVPDLSDEHTRGVTSIAFSHDGKRVVSPSHTTELTRIAFHDAENTRMFCDQSSLHHHGWIHNPHSELLFWLPPQNRSGLWWPNNTVVIGRSSTKIDFSKFIHGDNWTHCWS